MFVVDIYRQKMQTLKQRRGTRRAKMAAAAKRVVRFMLCSKDVPVEATEYSFVDIQAVDDDYLLTLKNPETLAGPQPCVNSDVSMDGGDAYNASNFEVLAVDAPIDGAYFYDASNSEVLTVGAETTSLIDVNTCEAVDTTPLCITPQLSLFAVGGSNHGEVANLNDLNKRLNALIIADGNPVYTAVDMQSTMAIPGRDNAEDQVASFADIISGKTYFDSAPVCNMSYQSLNAIASGLNNDIYQNSSNGNDCSDVSSTHVASDGTPDIAKVSNAEAKEQRVLELGEAIDGQFFDSHFIEVSAFSAFSMHYNTEITTGAAEYAEWGDGLLSWVFHAASAVAHAFAAGAH
ncbi:hypothetical protein H4R24_005303 [Coemansia sp. RSA 988]|nr:hypothetical protein H4R24_005303 [Coemansia sp. RSA 988]